MKKILVLLFILSSFIYSQTTLRIGVFKYRPKEVLKSQYRPLIEHLQKDFPNIKIEYQCLCFKELESAIEANKIDLVFTNSIIYEKLRLKSGFSGILATLVTIKDKKEVTSLGGVIFTHKDNKNINTLEDLKDKTIAFPNEYFLGGFLTQSYELHFKGITKNDLKLKKYFTHDNVVKAVLNKKSQVGFIRTGVLESLAYENKINIEDFKIINSQNLKSYPFALSTRLYPEWPVVALPHLDDKLMRKITSSLLNYSKEGDYVHIAGFTLPSDYYPVTKLLRTLHIPPYDKIENLTLSHIVHQYFYAFIIGIISFIVISSLLFLIFLRNKALDKKEKEYEDLYNNSTAMMLSVDVKNGNVIRCNNTLVDKLKIPKKEIIGKKIFNLYHPDSLLDARKVFEIFQEKGEVKNRYLKLKKADSTPLEVILNISSIKDKNGKILYSRSVYTDISESKMFERKLKYQEELNHSIIETIPDLVWLKDENGVYMLCNPMFEDFFGAKEGEIIGKTDYDFVDKKLADFFRENDKKAIDLRKARVNEEWITLKSTGEKLLLETTKAPIFYEDRVVGVMGIGHNITPKYKDKMKIEESKRKYKELNKILPVGVVIQSAKKGEIVFANNSACDILEMSLDELFDRTSHDPKWNAIYENGTPYMGENHPAMLTLKDAKPRKDKIMGLKFKNKTVWIKINTQPYFDKKGKIVSVIATFSDITKQKEIQKLLEEEKLRFQTAIEGTLDGLWDWNIIRGELFHSKQLEIMLGYNGNEIEGTIEAWNSLVHLEDREPVAKTINNYFNSKGKIRYVNRFRILTKEGEYIWVEGRGKAIFNKNGKPIRMIGFLTDISKQVKYQETLDYNSKHDVLTSLPNRFLFQEKISKKIFSLKENEELAIIYIDLDGFKKINDTFGHNAGDKVLIDVSNRMKTIIEERGVVSRIGGDEFVIFYSYSINKQKIVISLLKSLLYTINEPISYENKNDLKVSGSIGVRVYSKSEGSTTPDTLLREADQAMYEAKNSGKNRYHFFNEKENKEKQKKQKFKIKVYLALKNSEFELLFQPKIDIENRTLIGFEALLRWRENKELIEPDKFLSIIQDDVKLMVTLGEWVFETAFKQLQEWNKSGKNYYLGINVSANEFKNPHILNLLEKLQSKYPLVKPSQIELEILETHALEDMKEAKDIIQKCHKIGYKVALDDFGTGYSTLSYLKNLPVDTLKIDKSFISEMLKDKGSLSIVEAAIALANAFNCKVVAEGVEEKEQQEKLLKLGCNIIQGYYIAKPMEAKEINEWLTKKGFDLKP